MPPIEIIIAFSFAALLMNLSPGPSNLYVLARAVAQGTQAGLLAALGLAVGSLVHVFATVLGLSAVFTHSPALFTAVKLIGAAYLIHLGWGYWRNTSDAEIFDSADQPKPKTLRTVFWESVVVEVTNPKTALFFIAFLPQFVVPGSGAVWVQLLVLGGIVTLSAVPCDVLVAVSASKVSVWLLKNQHAQLIQERVSGSILLAMGAYIIADTGSELSD